MAQESFGELGIKDDLPLVDLVKSAMAINVGRRAWRDEAACKQAVGSEMYPKSSDKKAIDFAKSFCRRCSFNAECLATALDNKEPAGVWAGVYFSKNTLREIRRIQKELKSEEAK